MFVYYCTIDVFDSLQHVVYSGCRADASEAAIILLPSNITVFALDFSGSGLSGGEHVTLGWNEVSSYETIYNKTVYRCHLCLIQQSPLFVTKTIYFVAFNLNLAGLQFKM